MATLAEDAVLLILESLEAAVSIVTREEIQYPLKLLSNRGFDLNQQQDAHQFVTNVVSGILRNAGLVGFEIQCTTTCERCFGNPKI
jgi:hypothetical protein